VSDGWKRLETPRFVNPALTHALESRTARGEVRDSGRVSVEGETMRIDGQCSLEPGTKVVVSLKDGDFQFRSLELQRRSEREVRERGKQKRRARERYKDWKHRRAREFWNQYTIPFQWDVAIKGRRSGLLKGSSGTGRAANTVEHLYVRESFEDGRLSRPADCYLCDDSAHFRFDEGERRQNSDGESYIPPVTCSRCLDLMERWKDDDDGDGVS